MERHRKVSTVLAAALVLVAAGAMPVVAQTPVDIGGSLQLFTDLSLVQTLTHATLELHEPVTRQDGAGSVGARYSGGELLTKPIVFSGRRLVLNYSSAAAGGVRVEIQDTNGTPITGYALADSPERYGDEIEGVMRWNGGPDLGTTLTGTPVRLRFVLKDADLYSMRFANPGNLQYTVTYNANGATSGDTPVAQTKEHDVALTLALSGRGLGEATFLKKTGYTFAGWNTAADGSGTSYAEWSAYTNNASMTLYAQWTPTPASYAVTFSRNGATSGWGPAALAKTHGVALTVPSHITLTRIGYTFTCWNTAADGGGTHYAAGATYTNNTASTFYAQWTELPEPTILAQPANVTVATGESAAFSVTASGSAPLAYQWYRNDVTIDGATSSIHTTPATTTNDNAVAFKVTVTNAYGAVTSAVATLTVYESAVADIALSAATGLGVGTATLNGTVVHTNGSPTTFFFLWGTNDYGTLSTNPWTVVNCGPATNGQTFFTSLTGLLYGQRYWCYAYASNACGGSWSSPTNFLTTVPRVALPWTPTNLSPTTQALWLDAADSSTVLCNGTSVTNWLDKSGRHRTFAQTNAAFQPTYTASGLNGRSVIGFSAQYLTSTNDKSIWKFLHDGTRYTVHMVIRPSDVANPYAVYGANASWGVFGTGNSVGSAHAGVFLNYDDRENSTRYDRARYAVFDGTTVGTAADTQQATSDSFWTPASFQMASIEADPSNATATNRVALRKNAGTLLKNNTATRTPSPADPTYTLDMGAAGGGLVPLRGAIAEILINTNSSPTAERQYIEGYLAWKWGLNGSLPSDHPYYTAAPTFPGPSAIGLVNDSATSVTPTSAVLNATLTGSNTIWDIYAYWGPTDGTNNPAAWSHCAPVGAYTLRGELAATGIAFAVSSGIVAGAPHYFTFLASNAATSLWATSSTRFTGGAWSGYEAWRRLYFTADELTNSVISDDYGDKDGDRFPNWMEFQAGTDPTNGAMFLGITASTPNPAGISYVVTWPSVTGKFYTLQSTTNLVTSGFTNRASNIQATPPRNVYTDEVDHTDIWFYRVTVE